METINIEELKGDQLLLSDYLNLLDTSFTPPLSSYIHIESYAKKLSDNALIYTLKRADTQFIGLFAIYVNDTLNKVAYLTSIGVLQQYKGCGYAQILMDKLCEESKAAGMEGIKLEVHNNNEQAIRFYKRNKFVALEETVNSDTCYMYRSLILL